MALYDYVETTGVIVPDTGTLLTQIQNEFKAAFGQDFVVNPATPQGMLISAELAARDSVIRNNATLANQINPNEAGGIFLDSILTLTGGQRAGAIYSQVLIQVAGIPGTIILAGSMAVKAAGNQFLFVSTSIGALDSMGNATIPFQCSQAGAIAAPANTLTTIVVAPLGVETANNGADAVLGQLQQSDLSARAQRKLTLALQGKALNEAITSGLHALSINVTLHYLENFTSGTIVKSGVTLLPHSIYVCVSGGTDLQVATVLYTRKTGGTGYNSGASGIPVMVPITGSNGQIYTVSFDRPTIINILIRVTILQNTSIANPLDAIKLALFNYINGALTGTPGFGVGNSVSCFELAGAITTQIPGIFIKLVEVALVTDGIYNSVGLDIAVFQQAAVMDSNISVIVI